MKKIAIISTYVITLMFMLVALVCKFDVVGLVLYLPLGIILAIPFKYVWKLLENKPKQVETIQQPKPIKHIELDMWDSLADYAI